MTNSDFHRSAESCDLQTLLEVRDFLQDISTGADVTDASRDSATEFVALLDAEYAEKWEGSDGEPSNGKQPLMASRPAPPVPSDHTFSVAQSVGMRDPNEIAFELCEKWQKSKLDVYRNRTFSLDEISAFMSGVLAVLASQPSPAAAVETPPEVIERRRKGLSDYEKPPLGQPPSWLQEQEKIAAPHNGSSAGNEDVRWAVNYLLEQIAAKFEAWETFDLFRSEAAATVRSFKHDLSRNVGSDVGYTRQFVSPHH